MNKQEFLKEYIDYFAGYFSLIDDDVSDGAWFQMHIDDANYALEKFEDIFDIKPPKNIDVHDIVMCYLRPKESEK